MDKQDKTIIFIIIAVVTILLIGSTFAYFTWVSNTSQRTTVSFTSGAGFSCSANGGGNITSNDISLAPTTCTDTTRAIKRTVTVSPTITQNDGAIYLDMWLKVNSIGTGLSNSQNFKYSLTTDGTSCTSGTVVAEGNFNGATTNTEKTLLHEKAYSSTTTDTYYLWIWLDAAETDSSTQGQAFNISLGGSCTNQMPPQSPVIELATNAPLDNTSSTYVTASTGIDWNDISSDTNGKGIYIRAGTENDAHPIYYYRGAVTNNNVLFAGFCWKIVRTTSTGGTKLIYNGTPTGTNSNECNNTGTASQLTTTSKFNASYQSPADVGYMYGTRYPYSSKSSSNLATSYLYGNSFTYSNGTYTLTNTISSTGTWSSDYNTLNSNHYTCFNDTGTCSSVYYIYYTSSSDAWYITLTNGKSVEDALDEMLTSSTNTTNSTIKAAIDGWYSTNMTSYTNKLEDTPYCNDRTIYQLGGWSPTGSTTNYLYLGAYGRTQSPYTPSLTCNTNDAFTLPGNANGNGKLTYPVGLLTVDEIRLGGGRYNSGNSTYYLYTGQNWWSGSPYSFITFDARGFAVRSSGFLYSDSVFNAFGVRPAVSLKPGTKFASGGDGTPTNPYVVE